VRVGVERQRLVSPSHFYLETTRRTPRIGQAARTSPDAKLRHDASQFRCLDPSSSSIPLIVPSPRPVYRRAVALLPPSKLFSMLSILSPITSFLLNLQAPCWFGKTINSFRSRNRVQSKVDAARHVLNFNHLGPLFRLLSRWADI